MKKNTCEIFAEILWTYILAAICCMIVIASDNSYMYTIYGMYIGFAVRDLQKLF